MILEMVWYAQWGHWLGLGCYHGDPRCDPRGDPYIANDPANDPDLSIAGPVMFC